MQPCRFCRSSVPMLAVPLNVDWKRSSFWCFFGTRMWARCWNGSNKGAGSYHKALCARPPVGFRFRHGCLHDFISFLLSFFLAGCLTCNLFLLFLLQRRLDCTNTTTTTTLPNVSVPFFPGRLRHLTHARWPQVKA